VHIYTYIYIYIYIERERERMVQERKGEREGGREGGRESARALQEIEGSVCSMLSRITCELAAAAHVRRQASLST
jgi:hypothetical protein